ncbi:phage tail protein I [Rhodopseudomonas sp. P2A-2r]|uniref:phage tail protein I n=1 Tax=Rhodopseudomonas sp. P2A-2r TaxID=2991972 RepID=UPI002234E482|nr:phage tail protein I [Rhodopseudomonas sp. P2A-2r]UZE51126.1 phage tail protein I [Rhodopseudomonas sp. P2A-2r]
MSLTPDDHLLPANAAPLEQVIAASGRRIQAIPVPIDTVSQPYEVKASFLPFVGWGLSVDVWFNEWPETTKRNIAARSLLLHQKKGTLYAISEYARYAGGAVLSVERPPTRIFSGPSLTREQREAWLSRLPQVRVFLIQEEGQFGSAKAFGGGKQRGRFFERSFAVPSTALSRLHRRARWVVNGVEQTIRVGEFGSYFRLHFPSTEGRSVFCDRVRARRFFIPSTAWRRLATVAPAPRLAWRSPVSPTLQAVTSEPERTKIPGTRGPRRFSNTPMHGFFVPSSAKYRIFDRYAINDGSRPLKRPAFQFTGIGRYGFPAHTAFLRMSIPGKRSKRAAGEGIMIPRSRYWIPHDGTRVDNVKRAIQSAKRLSDRVLLNLGPKPRFIAGRPFFAGVDKLVIGRP